MQIFIINLEKDVEKKKYMESLLSKFDFNYQFVKGVNGKTDFIPLNVNKKSYSKFARPLTLGEVGTICSHRKALEFFLESRDDYSIILEDDVEIEKSLDSIFNKAIYLPKNLDVLLLGHHECWSREVPVGYNIWFKKEIRKGCVVRKPCRLSMGAYGYLVSRKGAEKLLKLSIEPNRPFDWYTGDSRLQNLYILEEPVILIKKELEKKSNLSKDRLAIEKKFGLNEQRTIAIKLKKKLKYKFWPLIKAYKKLKIKLEPFYFNKIYK